MVPVNARRSLLLTSGTVCWSTDVDGVIAGAPSRSDSVSIASDARHGALARDRSISKGHHHLIIFTQLEKGEAWPSSSAEHYFVIPKIWVPPQMFLQDPYCVFRGDHHFCF